MGVGRSMGVVVCTTSKPCLNGFQHVSRCSDMSIHGGSLFKHGFRQELEVQVITCLAEYSPGLKSTTDHEPRIYTVDQVYIQNIPSVWGICPIFAQCIRYMSRIYLLYNVYIQNLPSVYGIHVYIYIYIYIQEASSVWLNVRIPCVLQ